MAEKDGKKGKAYQRNKGLRPGKPGNPAITRSGFLFPLYDRAAVLNFCYPLFTVQALYDGFAISAVSEKERLERYKKRLEMYYEAEEAVLLNQEYMDASQPRIEFLFLAAPDSSYPEF